MKYLIIALLTAAVLSCSQTPTTCPDWGEGILGDLNGDGLVGLDDLNIMHRQLASPNPGA